MAIVLARVSAMCMAGRHFLPSWIHLKCIQMLAGIRNLAVTLCSIPPESLGRVTGIGNPRLWSLDGCRYWRIPSCTALVSFTHACVADLEIWMTGAQDIDAGAGWRKAYLSKELQVIACLEVCFQICRTPQE